MEKLNEIAQKAYECAVRRERLIPTMIVTTISTAICLKKLPKSLNVQVRNLHILKSI